MNLMSVDYKKRSVVWRMDPDKARAIADFLSDNTPYGDIAQLDAVDLRMAADRLEPEDEEE